MDRKIVPIALLTSLLGCSDDRQATEAALHQATQAWLDTQYPHCFMISDFPARTRDFDVDGNNQALRALARVGVLNEKEISRTEVPARLWQAARTDIYYAYELTEQGRTYYTPAADGRPRGGLCFGKAQVTAIERYTAPQVQASGEVLQVTYRYKVDGLPAWASDETVQASLKGLAQAVASARQPLQATLTLTRSETGWHHEG